MTNACGSYQTVHVKDFKIFVETDSSQVREAVVYLADQYNDEFGAEALKLVDERENANSHIRFVSGLRERQNKLGLGQWVTITAQEGRDLIPIGNNDLEKTVVHSMEIDFDLENFTEKMKKIDAPGSGEWRHLYHLFCHEVGHGLQMDHEDSIHSVMYRSIPDNSRPHVDYESYFTKARLFFQDTAL